MANQDFGQLPIRRAPPASVSKETLEKLESVIRISQPNQTDGVDMFQQLQEDRASLKKHNLEIVAEFRILLHELDVLKDTNAREREQHDIEMANQRTITNVAVAGANKLRRQLAEIRTHLKDSGKLLLDAVKAAEDATDEFPPEVQAYRPNPIADRLPTVAPNDDRHDG